MSLAAAKTIGETDGLDADLFAKFFTRVLEFAARLVFVNEREIGVADGVGANFKPVSVNVAKLVPTHIR